jgi:KDO2-lipid IV(A) lauroyltransferase
MNRLQFSGTLLLPKYWPSWLGILLWYLICNLLPFPVQIWLGKQLGYLLYRCNIDRTRVARVNIDRCYPHLSEAQRESLLRHTMESTAIGIFESGAAWFWPRWRFVNKYRIEGLEHLEKCANSNTGVLLMGLHFTPIEIGAAFLNQRVAIAGFYRPHKNPVYEYIQALGRIKHNRKSQVIANDDVRKIVKALRSGVSVNYAPDQDYGRRRSVFAPFFGIQTATVKAPAQLAQAGRAEIIPWVCSRTSDYGQYVIKIYPPITDELTGDDLQNAKVINDFAEARIRDNPEQYLWVHRRFKTRPEGEESYYLF